MSAKFTPGPWEVVGEFFDVYQAGSSQYICQSSKSQGERRHANAHLIAAAPDLYEALVEAKKEMWLAARHQWTMADFNNWAVIQQINVALTKADGKARPVTAALAKSTPAEKVS